MLRTDRLPPTTTRPGPLLRMAFIVSRFPKLTETFVLYEMLAIERCGAVVEVYPLQRERAATVHPEAEPYVRRAHYLSLLSWRLWAANLRWLRRRPGRYLGTLWRSLCATWGSRRYFFGIVAFFPKAAAFAEQMAAGGIQHVHAHFASHPAATAFIIHRLTGIPYSFTAHGSDLHRDQQMLREKVEYSAFAVAISRYNQQLMRQVCRWEDREKITVLHCGVDTQFFRPAAVRTNGAAHRPLNIFCIGTLHEVKGQQYLVQACHVLMQRGVCFHLHLIGDGPDRGRIQAQAQRMGLADQITLHGQMDRRGIRRLLQSADVVVAPSVPTADGRREGIPVVLMEAMSCAIPVVASRLSGIPELVVDRVNGFLVKPGDYRAIADRLEQLSGDARLRARLGARGRATVVSDFELHANAARLLHRIQEDPRQRSSFQVPSRQGEMQR